MLNLKQTAVAVLALGSSAVFAGTMGPVCAPGNVTVPCEKTAWDFGAQALYLQPTYSGDLGLVNVATSGSSTSLDELDPNWGWGFEIEGSYHFGMGNDLNVNWYHIHNTTTNTFTAGTLAGGYQTTPKWDAVNIEFGQQVDFGDMKGVRLHAGVQFGRVGNRYQVVDTTAVGTPTITRNAIYNGFGPRFGADMYYGVGNGFGVFGNVATALLIGTSGMSTTGYGVGSFNVYSSRTVMVPELEGKLGANYMYSMAQGDLTLDVGYMWVNYFNVVNAQSSISPRAANVDFGLNGIFFGAKWVGNV
jgi:hypothetical protein